VALSSLRLGIRIPLSRHALLVAYFLIRRLWLRNVPLRQSRLEVWVRGRAGVPREGTALSLGNYSEIPNSSTEGRRLTDLAKRRWVADLAGREPSLLGFCEREGNPLSLYMSAGRPVVSLAMRRTIHDRGKLGARLG
jgi:hypothetical protein